MIDILFNNQCPEAFVDFLVGSTQPAIPVSICTNPAPIEICWTITPLNNESGTVNPSSGSAASFSFSPNVTQARRGLRSGSRAANIAVGYTINVTVQHVNRTIETTGVTIRQDEISIIRQEYVDFDGEPPARDQFTRHNGAFNVGNYGYVVNLNEMQNKLNQTLIAYRGRVVLVGKTSVTIPQTAAVTITSAYRNPRRNVAAGSRFPITSRHVQGHAIDMAPVGPITVGVGAQQVTLGEHTHLYPALLAAAQRHGTALTEQGATPVPVGNTSEDHVHLQW